MNPPLRTTTERLTDLDHRRGPYTVAIDSKDFDALLHDAMMAHALHHRVSVMAELLEAWMVMATSMPRVRNPRDE